MPDSLFTDLFRDTEQLTWHPTEQVRQRARRRTRQTRIASVLAGAVAVAVVATGAVALAGGQDGAPTPVLPATGSPTPTPVPSATPSRTPSPPPATSNTPVAPPSSPSATSDRSPTGSTNPAVPAAAMLRLSDLPAGFTMTEGDVDGDWSLESVSIYCRNASSSTAVGQIAQRTVSFDSPTASMIQRVTRHSAGNAATVLDRVRAKFSDCTPIRTGDSLSVLADGLGAGDESLLVGSTIEGEPSRWLVVRQGDLVAQVTLDMDTTPEEARTYARPVAQRLCAGTDAC
ncbi:hypothetical protein ACQEUX_27065 [Micromonospora sp. CA-259024]|uniref:hypothetical protein n=1 Tax=Micromonospora sp. CA-259024 TaxID=3239965 RepID=UPI003D900399